MQSQNFCILQAFTQMAQMKGKSDLEQTNCRVKIYQNYQKVFVNKIINRLWSICQCKKMIECIFLYTSVQSNYFLQPKVVPPAGQ